MVTKLNSLQFLWGTKFTAVFICILCTCIKKCICLYAYVYRVYIACAVLSCFSNIWFFATPWTITHQAPLSIGLSKQEYWSGLPCPPPGDLPDPGTEVTSPRSLASQVDSLPLAPPVEPSIYYTITLRCVYMWMYILLLLLLFSR